MFKPNIDKSKFKKFVYLGIVVVLCGVLAYKQFFTSKKINSAKPETNAKVIASESRRKINVNKTYTFNVAVLNDLGQMTKKEGKIKFIITEAELKKDIKVKNETKQAADKQNYLILRLELQNDTNDRLAVMANKYIRLVGTDNKKFSPDFHNAVVAVDPLSVRRDLVAYIVNEDTNSFTFQIGDISGDKQLLEMQF